MSTVIVFLAKAIYEMPTFAIALPFLFITTLFVWAAVKLIPPVLEYDSRNLDRDQVTAMFESARREGLSFKSDDKKRELGEPKRLNKPRPAKKKTRDKKCRLDPPLPVVGPGPQLSEPVPRRGAAKAKTVMNIEREKSMLP